MFQRILVPLDGSRHAERAIPIAARIARASSGTIVFVRFVLPPIEFGTFSAAQIVTLKPGAYEARLAEAASYLVDTILPRYAGDLAGIEAELDIVSGAASPSIFSEARMQHVDLIVLCSQGESGLKRWVFGSVAQEAVRHSPAPVLVLNEQGAMPRVPDAEHPLRVLVPLDGSPLSESVLEPTAHLVADLAAPGQALFHLVQFVLRPTTYGKFSGLANLDPSDVEQEKQEAKVYLSALTDRLCRSAFAPYNLAISWSVAVDTDVSEAILKLAKQPEAAESANGYDLVAMASHGRVGLERLMLGSVTEHVVGSTKLPLFIVRAHGIAIQVQPDAEEEETASGQGTEVRMPFMPIF